MTKQRLQLTWYNKDKALIPTETGKYGYTWVDPSDPRYCETHTLVMDEYVRGEQTPKSDEFEYSERADLEPQDDNLMILGESGDVLEALTRVPELAEKYVGKVKLIYIDPPFNTAQTFANYEDNLEHSVWLTMMRDRLLHLKKLLSDDGSIWVHLDDVEVHRMRVLMDEVFGSGNFVTEMTWEKTYSPRNDSKGIPSVTDVILVYRYSTSFTANSLARTAEMDSRYKNPDRDSKGPWKNADTTAPLAQERGYFGGIWHPITGEFVYPPGSRHWSLNYRRLLESLNEFTLYQAVPPSPENVETRARLMGIDPSEVRTDMPDLVPCLPEEDAVAESMERINSGEWPEFFIRESGFGRKFWLSEVAGRAPINLLKWEDVGHTDAAAKEIKALFPGQNPFSTPKPERLLERVIHIATNPGDIVLDVFAGSGTTAAVAQKMGRRWVTCELVAETFERFTKARLIKVVNDADPGGVTRTQGRRIATEGVELPAGVSPEDAAKFTSVLNKLIADDSEAKKDPRVKALKAAAKTKRTKEVVNWRGGGSFHVAHLSPSCFDYDPALDRVMLTPEATGEVLVASVAANLGFSLLHPDDDMVFDGRRGNSLLKVVEGIATIEEVDRLVEQIQPGETIVLAATVVLDGVREHLRRVCKGSRVAAIPDDLFRYSQGGEL